MAKNESGDVAELEAKSKSRSAHWGKHGISNLVESAQYTYAVALDCGDGFISPDRAQAIATNVGKSLKAVEIQLKYGNDKGAALKWTKP